MNELKKRAFLIGAGETAGSSLIDTLKNAGFCDTRFGKAADFLAQMEEICRHPVQKTLQDVEPFGPKKSLTE